MNQKICVSKKHLFYALGITLAVLLIAIFVWINDTNQEAVDIQQAASSTTAL